MVVGSEAYAAALVAYRYAKGANTGLVWMGCWMILVAALPGSLARPLRIARRPLKLSGIKVEPLRDEG